jgi:hypothetical protein
LVRFVKRALGRSIVPPAFPATLLALSNRQLEIVMAAAHPLQRHAQPEFLQAVAARLAIEHEVGDGLVSRVCRAVFPVWRRPIVRELLLNIPIRIVAATHDTSVAAIEAHYSRHIGEHSDELSRRALLQDAPIAGNVIPIAGR